MVVLSLPPQLGVCLAVDQRLTEDSDTTAIAIAITTTNRDKCKDGDEPGQWLPEVFCTENLRHVAPYFVQKKLPIGKLAEGKTIGKALGIDGFQTNNSSTSGYNRGSNKRKLGTVVKNIALIEWWSEQLIGARLTLKNENQQHQHQQNNDECQRGNLQERSVSGNTILTPENGKIIATPDHVIREGDVLEGRYHFHEQSVLDRPRPTIVYQDKNYIVVNKPGGIDVLSNPDAHRVINSLPGIVLQMGWSEDFSSTSPPRIIIPAHRIDNPVSGLVCCGRTNQDAKRLSRRIQARETTKSYLARVKTVERSSNINRSMVLAPDHLPFDIEVPLGFDSSKGICVVDPLRGKPSKTTVLAVLVPALDDGTCVIALRPHTGRKHQLRKHLAHIGFPIANDEKYNKNDDDDDDGGGVCPKRVSAFGLPKAPEKLIRLFEDRYLDHCDHCKYVRMLLGTTKGPARLSVEDNGPSVSQPIWLHSWRYEFPSLGLFFEAPPPEWAHAEKWEKDAAAQIAPD